MDVLHSNTSSQKWMPFHKSWDSLHISINVRTLHPNYDKRLLELQLDLMGLLIHHYLYFFWNSLWIHPATNWCSLMHVLKLYHVFSAGLKLHTSSNEYQLMNCFIRFLYLPSLFETSSSSFNWYSYSVGLFCCPIWFLVK